VVDDLDAVRSERVGKGSESVERMDAHAQSLSPLVVGQKHDEALRSTDVQRVQDVVDLPHAMTVPARRREVRIGASSHEPNSSLARLDIQTPWVQAIR
jgi:hypothetical protein